METYYGVLPLSTLTLAALGLKQSYPPPEGAGERARYEELVFYLQLMIAGMWLLYLGQKMYFRQRLRQYLIEEGLLYDRVPGEDVEMPAPSGGGQCRAE